MRLKSLCTIAFSTTVAATAAMAAATQVNIADPTVPSRQTKVDVGNRLAVEEVAPATFYHGARDVASGVCTGVATPPAGKALILRQVRVDVYQNPSPGQTNNIEMSVGAAGAACVNLVADMNPPTIGQFTTTFDPGLAVPNGSALNVRVNGSLGAEVYVDGYKVDQSVVPQAGGQTIEVSGKSQR